MLVGFDFLKHFNLIFDYPHGRIVMFPHKEQSQEKKPRRTRAGASSEYLRSEGLEPPTYKFVACCSIQLSYDRKIEETRTSREFGERGIRTLDTTLHRITV